MLHNYHKVKKQLFLVGLSVILLASLLSNSTFVDSTGSKINLDREEKIPEETTKLAHYYFEYHQPSYLRTNIPIFSYPGISEILFSPILFFAVITDKFNADNGKSKRPSVINNGKLVEKANLNVDLLNTKIKGKTLEIYYYMKQVNSEVGIREITRTFGYSSPALAAYHLNRLVEFDLVTKTDDSRFKLSNTDYKIGKLSNYIQVGNFWFSQSLVFVSMLILFSIIAISYTILNVNQKIWGMTFIPLFLISLFSAIKVHKNYR